MYKKILIVSSAIGIISIFGAGSYYVGVHLPQQQKAEIEKSKLELQAQIEQEKSDQAQIAQIKADEESKKQADLLEKEELAKKEKEESIQKNTTARNTCLANAKNVYQKILQQLSDAFYNSGDVSSMDPATIARHRKSKSDAYNTGSEQASTNYDRAKNDCYHKYPLPNENF
mgnify:CR=1 FL=1